MRVRIASALLGLVLSIGISAAAQAQADDDTPAMNSATPDLELAAPAPDQPISAPPMFVTLITPAEHDLELPLDTRQLTIQGVTLPGAVVSIDGDLVDTDDQGGFIGLTALDEGANEIEVVASDVLGNQITTSIFVTRGE